MGNNQQSTFDAKVEKFEKDAENAALNWVRNDKSFNFLRGSGARVTLWVLLVVVLYGFGWFAISHPGSAGIAYPLLILLLLLAQKVSIRFVFDDDSIIDEYQHERRNKAYRRAYKRVSLVVGLAVAAVVAIAAQGLKFDAQIAFWVGQGSDLTLHVSAYQAYIAIVWLYGLVTLQKYLSWGFRGESN